MRITELRDAAETARIDDERSAALLHMAEERLQRTSRAFDRAGAAFAEALRQSGGRLVDTASRPAKVYTITGDGRYYQVETLPERGA